MTHFFWARREYRPRLFFRFQWRWLCRFPQWSGWRSSRILWSFPCCGGSPSGHYRRCSFRRRGRARSGSRQSGRCLRSRRGHGLSKCAASVLRRGWLLFPPLLSGPLPEGHPSPIRARRFWWYCCIWPRRTRSRIRYCPWLFGSAATIPEGCTPRFPCGWCFPLLCRFRRESSTKRSSFPSQLCRSHLRTGHGECWALGFRGYWSESKLRKRLKHSISCGDRSTTADSMSAGSSCPISF